MASVTTVDVMYRVGDRVRHGTATATILERQDAAEYIGSLPREKAILEATRIRANYGDRAESYGRYLIELETGEQLRVESRELSLLEVGHVEVTGRIGW